MVLKILFIPFLAYGHFQTSIAIGKYILFRIPTAEIYWIVDDYHSSKLKDICSQFKTLIYTPNDDYQKNREQTLSSCFWPNEKRFEQNIQLFKHMFERWKKNEKNILNLIDQVMPDFIINDSIISLPFIQTKKYRSILCAAFNTLILANQIDYPPIASGVDENYEWYTQKYIELTADVRNELNNWYESHGLKRNQSLSLVESSKYLNINLFPKFMNYFEIDQLDGEWIQISSPVIKPEVNKFIRDNGWINEKQSVGKEILNRTDFQNKPGKLILLSLGTLLSSNLEIFYKLLPIIKELPHKFIISKGKKGDLIKLPDNCVGANHLNQLELLEIVDLFITHAGLNSVCESIYYGVPMILIPGFMDQVDQSIRLEKFGIGKKIGIQNITKEELSFAIESMSNEKVKNKMKQYSDQVRNDNSMDKLIDTIINLASN